MWFEATREAEVLKGNFVWVSWGVEEFTASNEDYGTEGADHRVEY